MDYMYRVDVTYPNNEPEVKNNAYTCVHLLSNKQPIGFLQVAIV